MRSTIRHQTLLLCGLLLLAVPAAQAKKPDDERPSRQERGYYEQRPVQDQGRRPDARPVRDERSFKNRDDDRPDDRRRDDWQRDDRRYQEPRYDDRRYDQDARPAPRGMSLSDAVSEAERRTGGRVLSADPREENGQIYYRVKVLTPNGRVQMLYIDAR
jgi:hypothetical protein